jgi:hypothetical protein
LPDDAGFTVEERKQHRDPLADDDGVVRPDFVAKEGVRSKYQQWYRTMMFLRTWSTIYKLSQRSVQALTKMLAVVCGQYFTASMSRYVSSNALGLTKPGFIEYIACEVCHMLHVQCDAEQTSKGKDKGKKCGHVRRYKANLTSCPACLSRRRPEEESKAEGKEEKKDRRAPHETAAAKLCLRSKCDTPLFSEDGKPHRVYCYRPLSKRLAQLLARPGLEEACERWRRDRPADIIADITHGAIWQRFMDVRCRDAERCEKCRIGKKEECPVGGNHPRSRPFLSQPYGFGLVLNVDWFQPYEHVVYSVGVIYLTVGNIPREQRTSRENLILVGVMPGGKEADLDLDCYLEPLVDELLRMHPTGPGVRIATHRHQKKGVVVRAALVCVMSDLPAARKVSGYMNHNSLLGCGRCKRDWSAVEAVPVDRRAKVRPPRLPAPDVAVSEHERWGHLEGHVAMTSRASRRVGEAKKARTKKAKAKQTVVEKKKIWHRTYRLGKRRSDYSDRRCADAWRRAAEVTRPALARATGVKYSILSKLDYFKAARMTAPDPMHCLYMGVAKFTLRWLRDSKWKDGAEGKRALAAMQEVLDDMELPGDTCRILHKWESNMASINAAQCRPFVT